MSCERQADYRLSHGKTILNKEFKQKMFKIQFYLTIRVSTRISSLLLCNRFFFSELQGTQKYTFLAKNIESVNLKAEYRDCSPLSTGTLYGRLQRVTIPETVIIKCVLLKMSKVLLETC